jgi:hypothetical protein
MTELFPDLLCSTDKLKCRLAFFGFPFLRKKEEPGLLHTQVCKRKNSEKTEIPIGTSAQVCSAQLRKLGIRKREEENPKNYKFELIHDSKRGEILALHLCSKSRASTMM